MKKSCAAQLAILISISLLTKIAHSHYSGVYLYCTNKNADLRGYAQIAQSHSSQPFIERYGRQTTDWDVKNSVLNYEDYLYIYTDNRGIAPARLMDDNNQSDEFGQRGYLIFDTMQEAKTFCDGLSNFCVDTFGEEFKYAVGARAYLSGYYGIGVMYKEVDWETEERANKAPKMDLKSSICPTPRYKHFPNDQGDIP